MRMFSVFAVRFVISYVPNICETPTTPTPFPIQQETVSHLSTFRACQGEHDAVIIYHYTPIALNQRQEIYETSGRLCI